MQAKISDGAMLGIVKNGATYHLSATDPDTMVAAVAVKVN